MLALLLRVGVRVAGLVGPATRTVVAGLLGAALGLLGRLVLRAFGGLGRVVLAVLVLDRVGVGPLGRLSRGAGLRRVLLSDGRRFRRLW